LSVDQVFIRFFHSRFGQSGEAIFMPVELFNKKPSFLKLFISELRMAVREDITMKEIQR